MASPCSPEEDICAKVYDWTGSRQFADLADAFIGRPLAIIGLILLGLVVRWAAYKIVDRVVVRAERGVLPDLITDRVPGRLVDRISSPDAGRRALRARTLGELMKSVVTGVVAVVVGTMVLDQLGVNIAPIIASAGIIGIALGFGAQSLVKDFLSGIFMIMEDQYGVGDVIDVGQASGTVEAVSLRVTRLRDINGTVWYVPNGEILKVGNKSQNWARAVVDVQVSYGEDLERVQQTLRAVADETCADMPDLVLDDPEVTGVEVLGPDAVMVRVMVKTTPLQQWAVARELRRRIKARFDDEGIAMTSAQRVVWSPADEPGATNAPSTDPPLS